MRKWKMWNKTTIRESDKASIEINEIKLDGPELKADEKINVVELEWHPIADYPYDSKYRLFWVPHNKMVYQGRWIMDDEDYLDTGAFYQLGGKRLAGDFMPTLFCEIPTPGDEC